MTDLGAISDLQSLGYPQQDAAFLTLAAVHSGYFLRRQYEAFISAPEAGRLIAFSGSSSTPGMRDQLSMQTARRSSSVRTSALSNNRR